MSGIDINAIPSPGVYVFEDTQGLIQTEVADHASVYMVGSSVSGAVHTPTLVTSPRDFTAKFGASPSLDFVKLYFDQDSRGRLYFVRIDASATPTATDFIEAIQGSFNIEHPQGFLICPEAFSSLGNAPDKKSVALAMRDVCSNREFQWVALVDASLSSQTPETLEAEIQDLASERGHIAFYAPWVISLEGKFLPPSPAVAGVATARYRAEGFYQPPAGVDYPLRGVRGLVKYFGQQEQDVLNPLGINLLRRIPRKGLCVWGARTLSNDPAFRFLNQRVTFNVINRTLRDAFYGVIFDVADGRGLVMSRIKETANALLYRLWQANALFGGSPEFSYLVVCDASNNPVLDLEAGIVHLDVFAIPSPTLERLATKLVRVPIGSFDVQVA